MLLFVLYGVVLCSFDVNAWYIQTPPQNFFIFCVLNVLSLIYIGDKSGRNDLKATGVVETFACSCKMCCIWCLLLILINKFVWHEEHEWVNCSSKFGLHQSKTEGDTEDWIRDEVWNMLARNLKSVRGMRKKNENLWLSGETKVWIW